MSINTGHSDMVKSLIESNSLNSILSNTQAGKHHTQHDSPRNQSEMGGNGIHQHVAHQQNSLRPSSEGLHPPVTCIPEGRGITSLLDVPQEAINPHVRPQPVSLQGQITPQPPNAPFDKDISPSAPRYGTMGPSLTSSPLCKDSSSEVVNINPNTTTTPATPIAPTVGSPPRVIDGIPVRPLQLASLPGSPNAIKPSIMAQQQAGSPPLLSLSKRGSPMAAMSKPQTPSAHVIHHNDDVERPSVYTKTLQPGARPVSGVYSIASLRRQGSGAWWGGTRTATSSERPGLPSASGQRAIPPLKGFSSVLLRSKSNTNKDASSSPMAHTSSFNSVNEGPPLRSVSLPTIPVNPASPGASPRTPRRPADIQHGAPSEERTISKTKSKLLEAISDGSP